MKLIRFSLLAALAIGFAAPLGAMQAKSVRDGIEAWQRSDYAQAIAIWRPLAANGDADAAFNLGQAYRLGRGVPVNLAAAKTWLEKAANAGHLDAQTTLGLLLFDSGNHSAGIQWLKKAAERGEPRAMLVYGTALFNGDSVTRDPLMAYAYVSRAAAQGLEPAKSTLNDMDGILPVEVRRRAVEIALQQASENPAPGTKPKKPAARAPVRVAAKPPAPAPQLPKAKAAPAEAPTAASGRWRIQLGAFSKRSSAEDLYRKLAASSAIAGHPPYYVPAGGITRLQVGGFPSRASAAAACASLKGQACFPVEGK
ncbi:MAG: SPOR domain-containing protein [Sphingomicrobium sp.]